MAVRSVSVLVLLGGCVLHTTVPMEKTTYEVNPPAKCLVVLMPGAGSTMGDFEKEGFVQKLQESGLSLDVIAANAVLGYYLGNTMLPRVRADIVRPALQAKQYEKKWIMGMSMGGFGSLFYAMNHPGDFDGVLSLAPFLGDEKLGREIREAGGLSKWQAPEAEAPTADNYQRQLWRWLKEVTADPSKGPDLWMGWGRDDPLGPMDQLLGDALPKDHVTLVEGAHQWGPWNALVEKFVRDGPMAKDCRAQ